MLEGKIYELVNSLNQYKTNKLRNVTDMNHMQETIKNAQQYVRDLEMLITDQKNNSMTALGNITQQDSNTMKELQEQITKQDNNLSNQFFDFHSKLKSIQNKYQTEYDAYRLDYYNNISLLTRYTEDFAAIENLIDNIFESPKDNIGVDIEKGVLSTTEQMHLIQMYVLKNPHKAQAVAAETIKASEKQIELLMNEKYKLERALDEKTLKMDVLNTELIRSLDENKNLKDQIHTLEATIYTLQETINRNKNQIDSSKQKTEDMTSEIARLREEANILAREKVINEINKQKYDILNDVFVKYKTTLAEIPSTESNMFSEMSLNILSEFNEKIQSAGNNIYVKFPSDPPDQSHHEELLKEVEKFKADLENTQVSFIKKMKDLQGVVLERNRQIENDQISVATIMGYLFSQTTPEQLEGDSILEKDEIVSNLKKYVEVGEKSDITESDLIIKSIKKYLTTTTKRIQNDIQNGYKQDLAKEQATINSLRSELATLQTKNKDQSMNNTELQSIIDELARNTKKLTTEIEKQTATIEEQSQKLNINNSDIQKKNDEIKNLDIELKDTTLGLMKLKKSLKIENGSSVEDIEKALNDKLERLDTLTTQNVEQTQIIADLEKTVDDLSSKNEYLQNRLDSIFVNTKEDDNVSTEFDFNDTLKKIYKLFSFYEHQMGLPHTHTSQESAVYEDGNLQAFKSHILEWSNKESNLSVGIVENETIKLFSESPFVLVFSNFTPFDENIKQLTEYSNSVFSNKYTKLFSVRKISPTVLDILTQYSSEVNLLDFFVKTSDILNYSIQFPTFTKQIDKTYYLCSEFNQQTDYIEKDLLFDISIKYYIHILQGSDFDTLLNTNGGYIATGSGETKNSKRKQFTKGYKELLEITSYVMTIKCMRYLYYKKYGKSKSIQIENFCLSMMIATVTYYVENYLLFELITVDLIFSAGLYEYSSNINSLLIPYFLPYLFIN